MINNNNYPRQSFKPNSAFQTAGQSIIDHKENLNAQNTVSVPSANSNQLGNAILGGPRGPSPSMVQGRHHVS